MTRNSSRDRGFTLIEMMVGVSIMLVLMLMVQPSFESGRRRAAIRGAGEHLLTFWNQARFEAARRNRMVKVGIVQSSSGAVFCVGAATTNDPADSTPCDCTQAAPLSDVCDVGRFPGDQSQWNRTLLSGVTLGGGTDITDIQPVVIEPKRTNLVVSADAGTVTLVSPAGRFQYRLNLHVDRLGRAMLCESTGAVDHLSDFGSRTCAD